LLKTYKSTTDFVQELLNISNASIFLRSKTTAGTLYGPWTALVTGANYSNANTLLTALSTKYNALGAVISAQQASIGDYYSMIFHSTYPANTTTINPITSLNVSDLSHLLVEVTYDFFGSANTKVSIVPTDLSVPVSVNEFRHSITFDATVPSITVSSSVLGVTNLGIKNIYLSKRKS
jgi:hypothetical protein